MSLVKKTPLVPNNTTNINDLATSFLQYTIPPQCAFWLCAFQRGPHITKIPSLHTLNVLIHPATVLKNPEKSEILYEILVNDNNYLIGIKINKDDVENDPLLLN